MVVTKGYRISWDYEDEDSLLDPDRMTKSWQMGDSRPGLSVCRSMAGLLEWIKRHDAILEDVVLTVIEGEGLGDDLDTCEGSIDAIRIRAIRVIEISPLTYDNVMRIAHDHDGMRDFGLLGIQQAVVEIL